MSKVVNDANWIESWKPVKSTPASNGEKVVKVVTLPASGVIRPAFQLPPCPLLDGRREVASSAVFPMILCLQRFFHQNGRWQPKHLAPLVISEGTSISIGNPQSLLPLFLSAWLDSGAAFNRLLRLPCSGNAYSKWGELFKGFAGSYLSKIILNCSKVGGDWNIQPFLLHL